MCDYSLHAIRNRLAEEGENLVVQQFSTNSKGLASPSGFLATQEQECAVCIPPGAKLRMRGIPRHIRRQYNVGRTEDVTFVELDVRVNHYRDAVEFRNGSKVLINSLDPGIQFAVLSLAGSEERTPIAERETAAAPVPVYALR